jgi:hypothetical protein
MAPGRLLGARHATRPARQPDRPRRRAVTGCRAGTNRVAAAGSSSRAAIGGDAQRSRTHRPSWPTRARVDTWFGRPSGWTPERWTPERWTPERWTPERWTPERASASWRPTPAPLPAAHASTTSSVDFMSTIRSSAAARPPLLVRGRPGDLVLRQAQPDRVGRAAPGRASAGHRPARRCTPWANAPAGSSASLASADWSPPHRGLLESASGSGRAGAWTGAAGRPGARRNV